MVRPTRRGCIEIGWRLAYATAASLSLAAATACALPRSHDYPFAVIGVVTDTHGRPLEGVEVTLEPHGPVYQAVGIVRRRTEVTNSAGGFTFQFIAHQRSTPFALTCRKPGYQEVTLSGAAPPHPFPSIRLALSATTQNVP